MLTIGKIGGESKARWAKASYYSRQVVRGAEDYYAGKGEAPGSWTGSGAAALGLEGTIDDGELEAIFERCHPLTGEQLMRTPAEHAVRGIDLQMAVPKSVSTLWAVAEEYGRPEVAAAVWEATHGAARAAYDYLERNACRSRAGAGGHIQLDGEGFVGAVFPHRFSRAGDPQIHVHCLAANMTMCGGEGTGEPRKWRTLDAHHLYQHKKAAGYLFQAELRERLTERLGLEWTAVHKGSAEIAGVPRELAERLSQRHDEIARELERLGRSGSAREAELAALSTRQAKREFDLAEQRLEWRALAEEHGFGRDELAGVLGRTEFRELEREEVGETIRRLIGEHGATRERSAFCRRDLVEAFAAGHVRGGSVERIEALADRLIESDHVVALEGGQAGASIRTVGGGRVHRGEPLLTTVDMLEVEARMLDGAANRVGEGAGVVDARRLEEGFERRPRGLVLSDEQQAMVRRLVSSGDGVEVVRAKAGTGKTTALDAARELWEREGGRVVGAALAGRAADELRSRAGIESYTIHGLLEDLERGGEWGLPRGAVLVIDEAGMIGTRKCERLLAHAAAAQAKVVLVGDERQLSAIDAGGALAALSERLGASELTEVHRQHYVWDREALDELRHGDVSKWVEAYERRGRLVALSDPDEQLRALAEDWYVAAQHEGIDETLMLAARREEVESLNGLARAARVAAGELDDAAALAVGDRLFAVDDRVLATRNTHVERADGAGRVALRNGNAGTVTSVDQPAGELAVRLDSQVEVRLPADYLEDGHLMHGYARTIHKSQGSTATRTFVLGSPDLARELGYVAASRHTDESRFYVNVGDEEDLEQPPLPGLEDNPLYAELERALGRERAKALALDETEADAELGRLETTELLEITERGRRALTTIPRQARRSKDQEVLEQAAAGVAASERRLENARERLAGAGRRERRELEQRVWRLEAALERDREELAELTDRAAGENIERWLEEHEMELAEGAAAGRELAARRADAHWRARRCAELDADPALEALLGERPESPQARERWERAAAAQEAYRLQYGDLPDGHDPDGLRERQAADWQHARELAEDLHEPVGAEQGGQLLRGLELEDYGHDLGP